MHGFNGYAMMQSHYEMISKIDINSYKSTKNTNTSENKSQNSNK